MSLLPYLPASSGYYSPIAYIVLLVSLNHWYNSLMKTIYIAASARQELKDYIINMGYEVISIPPAEIDSPIASHADIQVCRLVDDVVVMANINELGSVYPEDAVFNACCTGSFFIHRLDITNRMLLSTAEELGLKLINVKQGYSRCSCLPIDGNSIIIYDRGIAKACESHGLDVLLVSHGNILLPGYDTGFIGGTAGKVGDTIVFNGDLSKHPDYDRIVAFIAERGLEVKYFEDWPLSDIGSII